MLEWMPAHRGWAVWHPECISFFINAGSLRPSSTPRRSDLDEPRKTMRMRRQTAEYPFGTPKARVGAAHFLIPRRTGAAPMSLQVLAYSFKHVISIPSHPLRPYPACAVPVRWRDEPVYVLETM